MLLASREGKNNTKKIVEMHYSAVVVWEIQYGVVKLRILELRSAIYLHFSRTDSS